MNNKDLVYELNHAVDEKITRLQPVNYKYLRWDQIRKYIIPISIDFSGKSVDEAQKIMHTFFEKNILCRATIDYNKDVHIKKMGTMPIKVYECFSKEYDKIAYQMGESMLERDVYNEILFDCCFFKNGEELIFFGLFSHLITDGMLDEKAFYQENFDYYEFVSYLDSIKGKELVNFSEYINCKKSWVDKYLSSEMNYYHFSISDSKRMVIYGYSFEELWILVIVNFLRNKLPDLNKLPINITSGGRKFNNKIINSFGDFHEDYILVIDDNKKFLNDFRYYRGVSYLNSKQYDQFLDTHKNNNYSQFIEPITISVKWKSNEYSSFQAVRKKLPPHAKNAVIGFNLLIEKNLKKVNIDIRASQKTQFLFTNFEEELLESYKTIISRR